MSIFNYFKRNQTQKKDTAVIAKERLQIIVAHQRGKRTDYLPLLQKELLAVISKYVNIDESHINFEVEKQDECSVLELNITLPGEKVAQSADG
jgi:cell division topological specificity factor